MLTTLPTDKFLLRLAEIKLDAKATFFYLPISGEISRTITEVRNKVLPESEHRDVDHLTLLYVPVGEHERTAGEVETAVATMRRIARKHRPIQATLQGWGYFDGAEDDGVKKTAVVALIDAPGLEDLHVDLKRAMRAIDLADAATHSYVPHVTLGYVEQGKRVDGLPLLSKSFTLEEVAMANRTIHKAWLGAAAPLGEVGALKAAGF